MTDAQKASKHFDDAMDSGKWTKVYHGKTLVIKDGKKVEQNVK
jgi:hypothetical protein